MYKSYLEQFKDKIIFMGGGYNNRCLSAAAIDLETSAENMSFIEGLCIASPKDSYFDLFPKTVRGIDESVSLDSLLED